MWKIWKTVVHPSGYGRIGEIFGSMGSFGRIGVYSDTVRNNGYSVYFLNILVVLQQVQNNTDSDLLLVAV